MATFYCKQAGKWVKTSYECDKCGNCSGCDVDELFVQEMFEAEKKHPIFLYRIN